MVKNTTASQIMEVKNEKVDAPEWQSIGKIRLYSKSNSSERYSFAELYVKNIDENIYYKVEDEHVTLLNKPHWHTAWGNFVYNAVTSKFYLYI